MAANLTHMQVFEFQADSSVSLASTAAINRKSCDHCFLNRKTCNKVKQAADSGEKCKRCAKDNRPCTFTPTVHLYHIADCVGRHQCRAKVIQAMGGIKNTVQFKTIEIPIVCDMDNESDRALFEYIQKNPNLLVYNNRIKSFLAQDMLGVSPDYDPVPSYAQTMSNYAPYPTSPTPSAVYGSGNSPIHGPTKHRSRSPSEQYSQNHRHSPYGNHSKNNSKDYDRHSSAIRPSHSPQIQPVQNYSGSRNPSLTSADPMAIYSSQLSPGSSPLNLSPLDSNAALNYEHPDGFAMNLAKAYQPVQQPLSQPVSIHPYNPYSQHAPYPQAPGVYFPQAQHAQAQQQQQQQMHVYRDTSSFGTSPTQQYSPQPPSPLDSTLSANTGFVLGNNNSQQDLANMFGNNLTMGSGVQVQSLHRRQHSSGSILASESGSPSVSSNQLGSEGGSPAPHTPLVIATTNADGQTSGLYHTVPAVNLNPGANESDLFHDFTVMDDTPVGENFVWVKNLFDDAPVVTDDQGSTNSTSSAIPIGSAGVNISSNQNNSSSIQSEHVTMEGFLRHAQQHDEWSSRYNPQDTFDNSGRGLQG